MNQLLDFIMQMPEVLLLLLVPFLIPRVWCVFGLHAWKYVDSGSHSGDLVYWDNYMCQRCRVTKAVEK